MPSSARLVLRCEDLQHEVFARRYFMRRFNMSRKQINSAYCPAGRGAADQWIRREYVEAVKQHRQKIHAQQSLLLAIVIDADTGSIQNRIRQLDDALVDNGMPKRQPHERILIFVPKRNIETWIHYLSGNTDVNEGTVYRKFSGQESRCKVAVNKLVDEICLVGVPADAPQSLQAACDELIRIL